MLQMLTSVQQTMADVINCVITLLGVISVAAEMDSSYHQTMDIYVPVISLTKQLFHHLQLIYPLIYLFYLIYILLLGIIYVSKLRSEVAQNFHRYKDVLFSLLSQGVFLLDVVVGPYAYSTGDS